MEEHIFFFVGDNAYPLSDQMLIPFSGGQRGATYNSSYNYYLSQLRIQIEQAFGLLTTKWCIFWSNLECDLETAREIITVATRLHNYVINADHGIAALEDAELNERIDSMTGAPHGLGYFPTEHREFPPNATNVAWNSARREAILANITTAGLVRPSHNLEQMIKQIVWPLNYTRNI